MSNINLLFFITAYYWSCNWSKIVSNGNISSASYIKKAFGAQHSDLCSEQYGSTTCCSLFALNSNSNYNYNRVDALTDREHCIGFGSETKKNTPFQLKRHSERLTAMSEKVISAQGHLACTQGRSEPFYLFYQWPPGQEDTGTTGNNQCAKTISCSIYTSVIRTKLNCMFVLDHTIIITTANYCILPTQKASQQNI